MKTSRNLCVDRSCQAAALKEQLVMGSKQQLRATDDWMFDVLIDGASDARRDGYPRVCSSGKTVSESHTPSSHFHPSLNQVV